MSPDGIIERLSGLPSGALARPFPSQLPALTALRLLLALGVALFHYHLVWSWNDISWTSGIERARLGLDVFFILSGFVLTHVYQRQVDEGRYNHGRFLLARLARIYPMHLAALAVFVGIVVVGSLVGSGPPQAVLPWSDLPQAVLMIQAWSADPRPVHWNGPSWSLSAEWFAYLIYPCFAWVGLKLARRPMLLIALAVALFVAADALYLHLYSRILPRAEEGLGVLRIVPEFLLGVGLYRLGQRVSPGRWATIGFAAVSGAVVLALMHLAADDRLIVLAAGPLVLALALLSKSQAAPEEVWPRWLLIGGEASFAFYLLHMPVLIGWRGAAAVFLGRPTGQAMAMWEVGSALLLTALLALAAHYLWERPARDWLRERISRGQSRTRCSLPSPASSEPHGSQA